MEFITFILVLLFIIGFVLVMRLVGAWMLRINEVINLLEEIKHNLKR